MEKELIKRFVKDYNLPINIFDEDMFKYYSKLYDFFPKETFDNLVKDINDRFAGDVHRWLDYCQNFRDTAITNIRESDEYHKFNNMPLDEFINGRITGPNRSLYTENCDGKTFISIDLKKANFQVFKYLHVIPDETYRDFVIRNNNDIEDEYLINSKYLRQVIFGNLNPSRTINIEKYMMQTVLSLLGEFICKNSLELYSVNSDELIYIVNNGITFGQNTLKEIEENIKESADIDVRIECIKIKKLPIVNYKGNNVDAYVRENIFTGEEKLKHASTTFFPQIYKLWKGLNITKRDLAFFFEDQICHFDNPLILKEKV